MLRAGKDDECAIPCNYAGKIRGDITARSPRAIRDENQSHCAVIAQVILRVTKALLDHLGVDTGSEKMGSV